MSMHSQPSPSSRALRNDPTPGAVLNLHAERFQHGEVFQARILYEQLLKAQRSHGIISEAKFFSFEAALEVIYAGHAAADKRALDAELRLQLKILGRLHARRDHIGSEALLTELQWGHTLLAGSNDNLRCISYRRLGYREANRITGGVFSIVPHASHWVLRNTRSNRARFAEGCAENALGAVHFGTLQERLALAQAMGWITPDMVRYCGSSPVLRESAFQSAAAGAICVFHPEEIAQADRYSVDKQARALWQRFLSVTGHTAHFLVLRLTEETWREKLLGDEAPPFQPKLHEAAELSFRFILGKAERGSDSTSFFKKIKPQEYFEALRSEEWA